MSPKDIEIEKVHGSLLIPVAYAELHSPLFIPDAGSLPVRLVPKDKESLEMHWDPERDELHVKYKGRTAKLSSTSVFMRQEGEPVRHAGTKPPAPIGKIEAQASTPQSHAPQFNFMLKGNIKCP